VNAILRTVLISGLLLAVSLEAREPTLARLSFWVPPERMSEFEGAYQEQLLPVLESKGLVESNQRSRATVDSVFCRLFEMGALDAIDSVNVILGGESVWTRELQGLGERFWDGNTELLRFGFALYGTPTGPGHSEPAGIVEKVVAGPGSQQGPWLTFDISDGFAPGSVEEILEDREGNLWFATSQGLRQYDGSHFTTFTVKDSLTNDMVYSILEDRRGDLWFGTGNGGVRRCDRETWTIFTMEDGLPSNTVRDILEDSGGGLWFATSDGVSRFDGARWIRFSREDGLADNGVMAIAEDGAGNLWFATLNGVSCYDGEGWAGYTSEDGLAGNWVTAIEEDSGGDLWFATRSGGVSRFDGSTWTTFTSEDGLADNRVADILEDSGGDLWFATRIGGVSRFDGSTWTTFTSEDGLANDQIMALLQDRNGGLWLGAFAGGVNRYGGYNVDTFTTSDGLPHNLVLALSQDQQGAIWIGTADGVGRFDGEKWEAFTTENGLVHNEITAVTGDRKGNMWFGTNGGVSRFDGSTWRNFSTEDGLADSVITFRSMVEDREGNMWFGTRRGGASRFDGKEWTTFSMEENLGDSSATAILEDRVGNLWFGTNRGVRKFDGSTWRSLSTEDGLPDSTVRDCLEDQAGNLWFATLEEGISRYDGEKWDTFTTENGLPHNYVLSIMEDSSRNLWFATWGGGVARYDGRVFQTLQKVDGLGHNAVQQIIEDENGDFWIATEGGITRYRKHGIPPKIHLVDVTADRSYGPVPRIDMSSLQDHLQIEFQGASMHTRPERMVYVYRLQGHEEDWKQTRELQVTYTDLPIGEYKFQVRAVDRDLQYSKKAVTVRVTVHPPYDQLVLIGGLLFALVGLAVATRLNLKRRRERDRAREERDQAREELVQELEEELQTAHDMQMGLMPRSAPEVVGFDIAGRCLPANHVGGDFFQFYQDGDRVALCMADVTGHAMEAAIPMVMFCGILENQVESIRQLEELFTTLNRSLHRILDRRTFVCFTIGELVPASRTLTLANGGNPYPYHFRAASGEFEQLKITASPLGMRARTRYGTLAVDLEPGDRIVFISDGIPEAEDAEGEIIGFERTAEIVRERCARDASSQEMIDGLILDVKEFTGDVPQGDDMTFIVLSVEGE